MRSFKKVVVLIILVLFFAGNALLSYLLYPYTYTRAMYHEMETADYDTLIVGGSHAKCGIDPAVLESAAGVRAINAAQGGEHSIDMYYLVREAAAGTDLKNVILEIDPSYWVAEPNQTKEYVSLYHEFPLSVRKAGYFADKMLTADFRTAPFEWYLYRQQAGQLPGLIREKQSDAYKNFDIAQFTDEVQSYHKDGFIARFRVDAGTTREDVPALFDRGDLNADERKYFEKLHAFCKKAGIALTCVITPVPETSYEAHRAAYEDASAYFGALAKEQGIRFIDYLSDERVPHDLEDFCDNEGHMFEDTAGRFTKVLTEDIFDGR